MANKLKEDLSRSLSRLHSMMIWNDKEFEKAVAGYNPSSFCVGFDYAMNLVKGLLTQMPDAVEVVRCKDCIKWLPDYTCHTYIDGELHPMGCCQHTRRFTADCDFCSYGERK